jgi:hypothetical protein
VKPDREIESSVILTAIFFLFTINGQTARAIQKLLIHVFINEALCKGKKYKILSGCPISSDAW